MELKKHKKEGKEMNYFKLVLLFLSVTLAACGGGGGGAPSASQGKFIDAAVEGITYTSGTLTGLTDAQGNFSYQAGQPVTFSIGGITLGTVSGSAIITPIQLVTGATNQFDSTVTNIVQFLLTIDDDGIASNGIQITPAMQTAAASFSLDFTSTTFDSDASSALSAITTAASIAATSTLVTETTAQSHLSDSLFATMAGNYSGSFSGADSGTWTVTVATDGAVTGSGISNTIGQFDVSGTVQSSGSTSVSGSGTAAGSTWTGNINITNGVFSGTWSDLPDSGTFTGNKI